MIKKDKSSSENPAYKNVTLTIKERVDDLVSRMTLEEKVSQMGFAAPAIERLDIPEYNWWNECLHGVARAGIATVFPQAIGLAATWDTNLMFAVATATSDEARAKYHEMLRQDDHGQYKGLTFWTPNINIFRDPRWGRGQETYGEDPYLTARMGVAFVKGLQGNDPKYLKTVATPKHFAVHSGPEPDRHTFDAQTSDRDLWETYLPAFEACIVEGKAFSIMGAYNRFRGEACCASRLLLEDILRNQWKFNGYVVSDCGAIKDIWQDHHIVETPAEAAALAVKRGCDLNCGEQYPNLVEAVKEGHITEEEIDISVKRLFEARFRLGMFDPPEMVPFAQIPFDVNACEAHDSLALKAARESIVLLKNEDNFLPLKKDLKRVAVIGPNAAIVDVLLGNYEGTPSEPVTPLDGIRQKVSANTKVRFAPGCNLTDDSPLLVPIPSSALKPHKSEATESGLKGEYFTNTNLEGEPAIVRLDSNINFDWVGNQPAAGFKKDRFSVRWTGKLIPPVTGEYVLGVASVNRYRLYVDDECLIDRWHENRERRDEKSIHLDAGREANLRLEFYEKHSRAAIKLLWGVPEEGAFQQAVELARNSEVAIFVGGISPWLEGEEMKSTAPGFKGGDRTNLELPQIQQDLLKALHKTGTPVVLVVMSGSALAINWANENLLAILHAWYPGQRGGTAIADVLFGDYNPAGRLPVTFYKSVDQLPPFSDYNMAGKTYRYFDGDVLYPFGFGLSYTTFSYDNLKIAPKAPRPDTSVSISVDVTNRGELAGDEVVQLYVTDVEARVPAPLKSLKRFQRIHLNARESKTVQFKLQANELARMNDAGLRELGSGEFRVLVGGNSVRGLDGKFTVL
ncbi:glycoside hydrolase family 3 C-terminal domain-containing protein [candidate division KSB1 bacterium]|nr:glycoside hydrolase family 3 C-terminal domain-containing protein [candidate division KSB1 bacterium]